MSTDDDQNSGSETETKTKTGTAAPAHRPAPAPARPGAVLTRLQEAPHRFTFVQAVRLWQREGLRTGRGRPVGTDAAPAQEAVRLRAHQGLGFQSGQVAAPRRRDVEEGGPPTVAATFMGLTGPNGALPQHYTELVIQRARDHDPALRDFYDIFNHRLLSHFWRAAAKYRLDLSYEQSNRDTTDPVTVALLSLVGLGLPGLRRRLPVSDERIVYYGGHFSHRPPSAAGLEQILSDVLGRRVEVMQFHGRWLYLPAEAQTQLGDPGGCRLGVDTVAGSRVWDTQTSLRLRVGPVSWAGFRRLQPDGPDLRCLVSLARLYLGPEFVFDVQVVLAREAVPPLRMGGGSAGDDGGGARLGWNTWSLTEIRRHDAEDAVFTVRDLDSGDAPAPE